MRAGPGSAEPRGVTLAADGVNVAVASVHASSIEFCRFDRTGRDELERVALPQRTGDVFHGFIAGVAEGERYGLRAHGPYAPHEGHRFNPAKLLVDPYARALDRGFVFHPAMTGGGNDAASRDDIDSAPFVPKGIVTPPAARAAAHHPQVPWSTTVIYELHVRGFTRLHPGVPEALRGTLAGLVHPAALAHLTRLGVTTVELMPLGAWIEEPHLSRLGLANYWGYNPVAPFAPDPRLAPGGIDEVRRAVDALHQAGFEVILDVVLNHTGEGDALGPTISLRGLDNATYYRTHGDNRARYVDDTGCGNALALDRPPALRLALDVLRYYAATTGVDGYRFDLATTLGRRTDGFDPHAPLFLAIAEDPLLRGLKLIAEPWDVGPGGYRLGAFPPEWGEWNDRYRDVVRRYWRGDPGRVGELATRIAGSADVFAARSRPPSRSINFVAAHDGFTLADLVAFAAKHNAANGEDNRDGSNADDSWNHGVEGPTSDPRIVAARMRDVRNLLATLFVSRGTPMLAMGDELGRTQRGNNNGYAQDNALTWLDWSAADETLIAFVARLIALRKEHSALREDRWLEGAPVAAGGVSDVEWRRPDGRPMESADWTNPGVRSLVVVLRPRGADRGAAGDVNVNVDIGSECGANAEPCGRLGYEAGSAPPSCHTKKPELGVAIAFNASDDPCSVHWPEPRDGHAWHLRVDTSLPTGLPDRSAEAPADGTSIAPRSVVIVTEAPDPSSRRRSQGVEPHVLDALAATTGIAAEWWDVSGERHVVGADTKRALLAAMGFPTDTASDAREHLAAIAAMREQGPRGESDGNGAAMRDLGDNEARRDDGTGSAPDRCFLPPELRGGARRFGLAAHLYALRRSADQGIGDFTTLAEVAAATARAGGSLVGINPLHALFPDDRERASPYHPSDRRFLDPIYIDVERVPDLAASNEARALLAQSGPQLRGLAVAAHVDYGAVWSLKERILHACFAAFGERPAGDPLRMNFERFAAAEGEPLRRFALYSAIATEHPGVPWQAWPNAVREPDAPGTRDFARRHARLLRYAMYLQWLADRQFDTAARAARANGLALGFFRDLAVGAAPDGAEVWANPSAFARGIAIGAPPDPFSKDGQNWHLPPPNPHALRASGCAAFGELLAANMRHAGALRIDHVMGLTRLYWIPDGAAAVDGAYVRYPLEALLRVLAAESVRARCLVVGEDLGTVPDGLRERLAQSDVLSSRVLWFEREGSSFVPPAGYPRQALASVSTHDLPTIAGWWSGADIAEKASLGLLDARSAAGAKTERTREKHALCEAIDAAGVSQAAAISPELPHGAAITAAIHDYLGAADSALVLLQADDLAGETSALNLPGTDRERPNWRRKVRVGVDGLWRTPTAVMAIAGLAARDRRAERNSLE